MSLLEVSNLRIRLQTHRGPADAVRGVSFSLARGETLGLIGESGCGKSITAMSLMGLLPESAQVTGSIRFDGQELVGRTDAQMCQMRGRSRPLRASITGRSATCSVLPSFARPRSRRISPQVLAPMLAPAGDAAMISRTASRRWPASADA